MEIRNIAIIAHVDHGKTTLTDALLKQTKMVDDNISMDSNALEQERGITIYSKNTSLIYKDTKINIVDTPGHADFSSEVERILRSIDSVLLLVDAQEGPMPQTKFVLKKSLELGLEPIVVINKIDKNAARPEKVHDMVLELFMELNANDKQLDFPVIYAIAKAGIAKEDLNEVSSDLSPLLNTILRHVKPASNPDLAKKDFKLQSFNLAYDNYQGRLAIARIYQGTITNNSPVFIKNNEKETRSGKISKLYTFLGHQRQEVSEAYPGDIVMIAGLADIDIGETICENKEQELMPSIKINEPTLSINLMVNNSPFAGKEGKYLTSSKLKERLEKELEINVGLKIDFQAGNGIYKISGRGELHLAILLENMRRELFEMKVSQPKVIFKEVDGQILEPFEELTIDIPEKMAGTVIEKVSQRKGVLVSINNHEAGQRLVFKIPTRSLIGYRSEFVIDTKGEGLLSTQVIGFEKKVENIENNKLASMISMENGKATAFALWNLEARGTIYIKPNTEVYSGMVIGNASKGNDLWVNPVKGKKLTNVRSSNADEAIILTPPLELTLERGLEIMKEDEYLEITPKSIRLMKEYLTPSQKAQMAKKII